MAIAEQPVTKVCFEDVINRALQQALTEAELDGICDQCYAQELFDMAVEELDNSDRTVAEAARASVQYYREYLSGGEWESAPLW